MCPKLFSWAKNKRKLFSDGKSRGPLLAGAALKYRNDLCHGCQILVTATDNSHRFRTTFALTIRQHTIKSNSVVRFYVKKKIDK